MLPDPVKALIRAEYERRGVDFIDGTDLDSYLAKLDERAEVVSDSDDGRCRGFVAFYCNDMKTRQAYVTLVLVDPRDRGRGLARALIERTLDAARSRGFVSCRLEVARDNAAAQALYRSIGFHVTEARSGRDLLEKAL